MLGVHEVFHLSMLWRYTPDPAHVVDWGKIEVDTDGTFEEGPVRIMDNRDQVLRRKTVRLLKVLWQHRGMEEATWENEDTMRATYPFLFRDEGTQFRRLIIKLLVYMHEIVHVAYACDSCACVEFRDEILLMREECKTREKTNFLKKCKTVISVKIQSFSRSQMMKRASPLELSHEI